MKLLRCRKCGAVITTQDTMVDAMRDEMQRLNRLAVKDRANRNCYQQQSAQVEKLMRQIIHLTSECDEDRRSLRCQLSTIVRYIRDNHLIPDKKLDELKEQGRCDALRRIAEEEQEINRLYGTFESVTTNRTKSDPTAREVMRRIGNK